METTELEDKSYQRSVLEADYVALQNDLTQAHSLLCDIQGQLSDKTNELAQLKLVWERAHTDLKRVDNNINALRKDRHRLANEVMASHALQHQLEYALAENERLRADLLAEREEHARTRAKANSHDSAMRRLADHFRHAASGPAGVPGLASIISPAAVAEARAALDRLAARLTPPA